MQLYRTSCFTRLLDQKLAIKNIAQSSISKFGQSRMNEDRANPSPRIRECDTKLVRRAIIESPVSNEKKDRRRADFEARF